MNVPKSQRSEGQRHVVVALLWPVLLATDVLSICTGIIQVHRTLLFTKPLSDSYQCEYRTSCRIHSGRFAKGF